MNWHENRSVWVKNYADFDDDKIKTDKKPEVREKSVFHTFSNQNTTKTDRESKLSMLNLLVIKQNPTEKPEVREKSVFLLFLNSYTIKTDINRLLRSLNSIKLNPKPIKNRMTVKNGIFEILNIKHGDEWVFHSWFTEIPSEILN